MSEIVPRRYFRLTGSLIALAEQWRANVKDWNKRLRAFFEPLGATEYERWGRVPRGVKWPHTKGDPPEGWRRLKGGTWGYIYPDKKSPKGKAIAAEMSALAYPEPDSLWSAIDAKEDVVTGADRRFYLGCPLIHPLGDEWYISIPSELCKKVHLEMVELKRWEWVKIQDEHKGGEQ